MAYYASYDFYNPLAQDYNYQAPEVTSAARLVPSASLRPQASSANIQNSVVAEPVVVENRSYVELEKRVKSLESQLSELSLRQRRVREEPTAYPAEEEEEDEEIEDYEVGDDVEGLYMNGRWYPAKIAEKYEDGTYLLNWNDRDTADRQKNAHELRRIAKSTYQVGIDMRSLPISQMKNRYEGVEGTSKNVVYLLGWVAEEAVIRAYEGNTVLTYKEGDVVQGWYKNGRWYDAVIQEVRSNGTYLLNWNDGDSQDREKMIHQLRKPAIWEDISSHNLLLLSIQKYKPKDLKPYLQKATYCVDQEQKIIQIQCKTAKLSDFLQCIHEIHFSMGNGTSKIYKADLDENEIVHEVDSALPMAFTASPGGVKRKSACFIGVFSLNEDEVLTEVYVKYRTVNTSKRNGRTVLEAIRFVTSKLKESDWFGQAGDRPGDYCAFTSAFNPINGLLPEGNLSTFQAALLADGSQQAFMACPIDVSPTRLEDPKFSTVYAQMEGEEDERLRLKVQLLKERGVQSNLSNTKNRIYYLDLKFKHEANTYTGNDITPYTKPGLKESFDLIDASEKVITLLSRIIMANKWAKCSPNIYGFFIRNLLLAGSTFDGQVVPQTKNVLILSSVAVLLTFGMQMALAWYLWANLPFNQDYSDSIGGGNPAIDHIWSPNNANGNAAYSICRTHPVVQVICIGLFLFYMLTSTPAIIKNVLIILWSHKFVSRDINGVARIHYWRSSSFWSGFLFHATKLLHKLNIINESNIFVPFQMQVIDWDVLRFFQERGNFYLPLSIKKFPWTMSAVNEIALVAKSGPQENEKDDVNTRSEDLKKKDWVVPTVGDENPIEDRRIYYETQETKAFFRRKLKEINGETFDVDEEDEDEQDKENREAMFEAFGNNDTKGTRQKSEVDSSNAEEKKLKIIRTMEAANYLIAFDYCDGETVAEIRRIRTGYHALLRSVAAILFGVVPEIVATMMILICGCQYILWSGSQVGSNTNGLEEIILATVAITFINEIDEALFEHALPELYKCAHDRDQFDLENWIPAEEPAEMEDLKLKSSLWLPFGKFICWPRNDQRIPAQKSSADEKSKYTKQDFLHCMYPGKFYDHMSHEQHSDLNFAKQYPFLYARKFKYFFHEHFFEGFVWAYGSLGLHIIILSGMAIAIVGAIRIKHECSGKFGPFSPQQWPETCNDWILVTTGQCSTN